MPEKQPGRIRAALQILTRGKRLPQEGDDWAFEDITPAASAGIKVTEAVMLSLPAVLNAVTLISSSVAMLPAFLYQRLPDGGKEQARDNPLFWLIHDEPNPLQTAFKFFEMQMGNLLLRGNAYAEIQRDLQGDIIALWPWPADRVKVETVDNDLTGPPRIVYIVQASDGTEFPVEAKNVLHVAGFGLSGILGLSSPDLARDTLGTQAGLRKYFGKFFGNGAWPGGFVKHPGKLSDPALKHLRKSLRKVHGGVDNAHRVAILEEGMDWSTGAISPEDAQALESQKFGILDVARIFNIQPHLLKQLDNAIRANVDQQGQEFVTYTLGAWLSRWEQELKRSLIPQKQKRDLFFEFKVAALLRGDIKTRYESYKIARADGWLNPDEIRAMENLNPLGPGQGGKDFWRPQNMAVVGAEADTGGVQNEQVEEE